MNHREFLDENEAARRELGELIARLDERSFQCAVGPGWTVSTLLCHLAFWDQRVLFLLREWQRGPVDPSRLSSQSIDSINEAVKTISKAVPGPAAAKLALDSAAAVDSELTRIGGELADRIVSAGQERYLRRSLHRREHLRTIQQALHAQPGGAA